MLSRLFLVRAIANGKDKSIYIKAEKMEEALDIALYYFGETSAIVKTEMKMSLLFEPEEEVLP